MHTKINPISVIVLLILLAGCSSTTSLKSSSLEDSPKVMFERTALPSAHPLVGVWRVDFERGALKAPAGYNTSCIEEYTIRPDGTKLSRSGEERNESEFMITAGTRGSNWLKWIDKITTNNGKPDCSGTLTAIGHTALNYVIVHPSGQRFAICEKEDFGSCYVELFRQSR